MDLRFSQAGPGWRAECHPGEAAPLRFCLSEMGVTLHVQGSRIDEFGEHLGEIRQCRAHRFLGVPGGRGEMLAVLPFGAEPRLARRWTVFGRAMRVASEIRTHPGTLARAFAVEELRVSGAWRQAAWHALDPATGTVSSRVLAWPESDGVVAEDVLPPLAIVLENQAGGQLELGIAEDWWRWRTPPERFAGTAAYRLRRVDGEALVERIVLAFPEERALPSRPWLFNSHIAWHPGGDLPVPPPGNPVPVPPLGIDYRPDPGQALFRLCPEGWPESALSVGGGDDAIPRLCLMAPAVRNALRRWIRAHADAPQGPEILALVGVMPGVCGAAAHLERPQRGILHHGDIAELIAFHTWANRQLLPRGRRLLIFPAPEGILAGLPTFSGMGEPVVGSEGDPDSSPACISTHAVRPKRR
jgi:hypothetical protein